MPDQYTFEEYFNNIVWPQYLIYLKKCELLDTIFGNHDDTIIIVNSSNNNLHMNKQRYSNLKMCLKINGVKRNPNEITNYVISNVFCRSSGILED